jgi:SAM-dependent methyltransferase
MTEPREVLDPVLAQIDEARNYNDWIFQRARPFLGERVLDSGAGIGTFTERAVSACAAVVALEPDPLFAERLEARFATSKQVRVEQAGVEDVDHSFGEFDSIMCFNVLEHVGNDAAALRTFRARLRAHGRLLLLVPAHPGLYGPYDRAAGHERRYTRRGLAQLLSEAGFATETLRHVNPLGAVGWLIRVRLRRQSEWPSTSFQLFDRLVPAIKPLDRLPLPFGLSLWAVARAQTKVSAR